MFDIGFSELLVIGVVALIVLGPERLPKVARTAGHLLGRFQRYVSDVKAEIKREMHNEEIMKLSASLQEAKDAVTGVEQALHEQVGETGQILKSVPESVGSLEFVEEPRPVEVTRSAPDEAAAPPAEPSPQLELPLPPLSEPPAQHIPPHNPAP
ncbi:Sec-independent protein translocase protein TatB [Thiobacter aerophilum]|uniref:Sec-independent protein translocase protein TatB n=1 Tax=Thiobacter aerophilum TaxID=3121275 RepID=A0ABV0EGY2_9BURK